MWPAYEHENHLVKLCYICGVTSMQINNAHICCINWKNKIKKQPSWNKCTVYETGTLHTAAHMNKGNNQNL